LKRFLLTFILFLPKFSAAQAGSSTVVAIQSEVMPMNTAYHVQSLMFGMQTDAGDQYLIGPAFKSFLTAVGHQRSYAGIKLHTHIRIARFAPFLSYEMMWGKYYIYGAESSGTVAVKQGKQGKGVLGTGYALSERLMLFAGVSAQDYDPLKYHKTRQSPYKSPGLLLKVAASMTDLF
jgi:hypothetical protein